MELETQRRGMKSIDTISLREYVDEKLKALEQARIMAFSELERRLENMNEFRAQLNDQAKTFVTKNEHQIMFEHVTKHLDLINTDIRLLREFRALMEGKASQESVSKVAVIAGRANLIAFASLIVAIASVIVLIIVK
jgi:hypothetical protein